MILAIPDTSIYDPLLRKLVVETSIENENGDVFVFVQHIEVPAAVQKAFGDPDQGEEVLASAEVSSLQITLHKAIDGLSLCAEVNVQHPSFESVWPTCQTPDGQVARLVYPPTVNGEVPVRNGQALLLMFDVQGRYQEPWTVLLSERRELSQISWVPSVPEAVVVEDMEPDSRVFQSGAWPSQLPMPEADLVPVFLHVLRHKMVSQSDLHAWMDRQGLGRSARRAFSVYLDYLVTVGWPIVIRDESHQISRFEVDQRMLDRLGVHARVG